MGVGAGVGFVVGVGVFVAVSVGKGVGVGAEGVGESVAVGVASGVAAGVGDAVTIGIAVTTLVGKGVCRRCPPTPRDASVEGGGSVPPQAETTTALTIKATTQATTGPGRTRFLSRAGSHAREPAALRLCSGQAWEPPLLGIRDLLGFNLRPMLELVANLP